MNKFSWADGYRAKISADVAGKVLEPLIKSSDNFIAAKSIVNIARDPKSPLHTVFEWDDTVAGEQYRTEQARKMLHSLRIKVESVTDASVPVRFLVSVRPPEETASGLTRRYTSISYAMTQPELRRQVLSNALKELESFRQKYAELEELIGLNQEIEKLIQSSVPLVA